MIAQTIEEVEKRLKSPFPAEDIEWRIQRSGIKNSKVWAMCIAYVTNRAIMNRLDEVVGMGNWKNEYKELSSGALMCGISVLLPSKLPIGRRWVIKWDGADKTEIEPVKGCISGASKRSAVLWGIGRYLYNLDINFADVSPNGKFSGCDINKKTKEKTYYKWTPPNLPSWALPGCKKTETQKKQEPQQKKTRENPKDSVWAKLADAKDAVGSDKFDKAKKDCNVTDIYAIKDAKAMLIAIDTNANTSFEEAGSPEGCLICPNTEKMIEVEVCKNCNARKGCPAHESDIDQ